MVDVAKMKTMIEDRIAHVVKKIGCHKDVGKGTMSLYAKGFSAGKVYRLLAEKYFLEELLKEV